MATVLTNPFSVRVNLRCTKSPPNKVTLLSDNPFPLRVFSLPPLSSTFVKIPASEKVNFFFSRLSFNKVIVPPLSPLTVSPSLLSISVMSPASVRVNVSFPKLLFSKVIFLKLHLKK